MTHTLRMIAAAACLFGGAARGALLTSGGEQLTSGGEVLTTYGPPDFTAAPRLIGPPVEGRELVASSGTIYDDGGTAYPSSLAGVQFRVADDGSGTNATNISGVTAFTFWLPNSSVRGKWIGVRATATNAAGSTTSDTFWMGPILPHRN